MAFVRRSVLLLVLLIFCAPEARAQKLSPVVSAAVGVSSQGAARSNPTNPSVELQLSQVFFTDDDPQLSLRAAVFWGYWASSEHANCEDCQVYSFRTQVVGARLRFSPSGGVIEWGFEAGIARRFVWADYESGFSLSGREGEDFRTAYPVADLGLELTVPVSPRFDAGLGARGNMPLVEARRGTQFGIRYGGHLLLRYHLVARSRNH